MKTKRLLAMLLVMILTVAMAGSLVGCSSKDSEADKKVESQKEEKDTEKTDGDVAATSTPVPTATPEPTATPVPTPTPEVLPTAEELIAANEGMISDNIKMTMEMAYTAVNGIEEAEVSAKFVEEVYENVSHEKQEMVVTMMGQSQMMMDEMYYVDDEATGLRTEYFYHVTERKWTKSQYAYIDLEEDDEEEGDDESALERMVNTQVTRDGDFYYLIGDMSNKDVSELTGVMGTIGLSADFVVCEMKFDAKTKKFLSAMITVKLEEGQTTIDGVGMSMDKFVVTMEELTEPIVIPEEALAAESDVEVDIDWEIIDDEDDEEDTDDKTVEVPEPGKYAKSEMPEGWDGWYDEYNCKSGSFLMWSDEFGGNIPITIYEKENWYFDNQYEYSLYLAVDDPAISDYAPAYEVDYSDSYVDVSGNLEREMAELVTRDYTKTKGISDVVPIVCNGKQCFYLDVSSYENVYSYIIFQDIGMETFVEIAITTYDNSDPLTVIQKFLLDISQSEGQQI